MTDDSSVSRRPKWFLLIVAISAVALLSMFLFFKLNGEQKTPFVNDEFAGRELPNGAQTFIVGKQSTANALSWQGTVRSRLSVKIAAKIKARIIELPVHAGDSLQNGATLVRLDSRDISAAYNAANADLIAAQAKLGQAKSEEKRQFEAFNKQLASRQEYDAALVKSEAAQALADQAATAARQTKALLGGDVLYAPFDGIVGERLQEVGETAMPEQAILTFYKSADLRLEAAIAERCATLAKLGMPVTVRIEGLEQILNGSIDEIAPEIDLQTRTRIIKVRLPQTVGLQQGQLGWLEFGCHAEQQTLLIPVAAIVHYGQSEAVKVLLGQQLHIQQIRTGKRFGDQVEVLSGLHEGDTIFLDTQTSR